MRSKFFLFSSLIVVLVLIFPIAAMGQTPSNYVVVKGGMYSPTGDLKDGAADFDSGFNGEIAYGHYFDPNLVLEAGIGYFKTEDSFDEFVPFFGFVSEDDEITVVPGTVTLKAIAPLGRAELYGGPGIGIYFANIDSDITIGGLSDSDDDSDTVFGFHVLVGLNVNVSDHVFIGVEGKHFWTGDAEFEATLFGIPATFETNLNGYTVTGNLGFRF